MREGRHCSPITLALFHHGQVTYFAFKLSFLRAIYILFFVFSPSSSSSSSSSLFIPPPLSSHFLLPLFPVVLFVCRVHAPQPKVEWTLSCVHWFGCAVAAAVPAAVPAAAVTASAVTARNWFPKCGFKMCLFLLINFFFIYKLFTKLRRRRRKKEKKRVITPEK